MINKLEKMPDVDYFASEGLSQSFMKAFDESPAYAFSEREQTESMEDGKILHTLLLEPEKIDERLFIIDRINRNTKEYKALVADNPCSTIKFTDEMDCFYRMRDNVMKLTYDFVSMEDIIKESQKEIACFSDISGYPAKAKFDLLWKDKVIFDLKMTSNMKRFRWQVKDFGYYRQADWYKTIYSHYSGIPYEQIPFIFIVVENKFPYGAKTIELTDEYLQMGSLENIQSIREYENWIDRGADKTEIYINTHEIIGKGW
jgi:hypothetical protein